MSIDSIPVKPEDTHQVLQDSANQITFINTAIVAICERTYSDIGEDELMGLQNILFNVERKIRGVTECLYGNGSWLIPEQPQKTETTK